MKSGKPLWRAGKKGVRRLQRDLLGMRTGCQIPLLSNVPTVDAAWGSETAACLLLLPALPSKLLSLRQRAWPGRWHQSRLAAAGVLVRDTGAVCRCCRRRVAALCQRAAIDFDGAALHRGGR